MTYQKSKKDKGNLLVDIVLSLSILSGLIVGTVTFLFEWSPMKGFIYGYVPLLLILSRNLKFGKNVLWYLLAAVFLIVFQLILKGVLNIGDCIFWLLIPYVLMNSIYKYTDKYNILLFTGITIYLINCAVVIFEYVNQTNLFYVQMDYLVRFRATGIYGHPLYGALLHSSCMLFILQSRLYKPIKLILYSIGFFVIFCYDARAATVATILATCFMLYKWKYIRFRYLIYIGLLALILPVVYDYLESSGLGGKLFTKEGTSIEKDDARIVAFRIFFDRSLSDIFWGVIDQDRIAQKYGVICVENGALSLILKYGLIPAILLLSVLIKNLISFVQSRFPKVDAYIYVGTFLLVAVTSQALAASYVWIDYILLYSLFCCGTSSDRVIMSRLKQIRVKRK